MRTMPLSAEEDVIKARWILGLGNRPPLKSMTTEEKKLLSQEIRKFVPYFVNSKKSTRLSWFSQVQTGLRGLASQWKRYKIWKVRIARYRVAVMDFKSRRLRILRENPSIRDGIADQIFKAMELMEGKLRRCVNLRCKKFFIGHKRQRYCTTKCGVGVRVRRFRYNKTLSI